PEQDGASRERIQQMLGAVAAAVKQAPAIVIAEPRRNPCLTNAEQRIEHLLKSTLQVFGNGNVVARRQHDGMQKKVQRIHVIIGGLLEMHSIREHLRLRFLKHNLPAEPLPPAGGTQLWAKHAEEK